MLSKTPRVHPPEKLICSLKSCLCLYSIKNRTTGNWKLTLFGIYGGVAAAVAAASILRINSE